MRLAVFTVLVLAFTGCAAPRRPVVPENFDPATVRAMGLDIDFNPQGTGLSAELAETLEDEISGAFSRAGYAVIPERDAQTPSFHRLRAWVDSLQRKGTPRGFTLTFGNSDPRSQDFQKADVRPITCSLEESDSGRRIASRTEDYIDYGETSLLGSKNRPAKLKAFYYDNIGATCHELLLELGIEPTGIPDESEASVVPRSSIRMEVIDAPESEIAPVLPSSSESRALEAPPASGAESSIEVESRPSPGGETGDAEEPPASRVEPPVKVESSPAPQGKTGVSGMLKKQVKIFNKGDTVILKFGHERQ